MSDESSETLNGGLCKNVYFDPFIPKASDADELALIFAGCETFVLFLLIIWIQRKHTLLSQGHLSAAKNILLPIYDRVIYFYMGVTVLRAFSRALMYFELNDEITADRSWYTQVLSAVSVVALMTLEVFVVFLLMQTSAGKKAFIRAAFASLTVAVIEMPLLIVIETNESGSFNYAISGAIAELILFFIILCVLLYCYCYQQSRKKRIRIRNQILYIYIFGMLFIYGLQFIIDLLYICEFDSYCFEVVDQYFLRLGYPLLFYWTIRSDSQFWRLLLLTLQTSSDVSKAESWLSLRTIFGRKNSTSHPSFYDPLIDALSMGVKMVDFTELVEYSDNPIAMGSTATVSTAKLRGETVACKVFIFDELSLDVISEFFRESLLISDIVHENIVQFKGACLRPPELCLIYEFCSCGDLTHLLLTQYFHSGFLQANEEAFDENGNLIVKPRPSPKVFIQRLKMMVDVARGMTRLHDAGIIHRDLKTSNILVHYDESRERYVGKVCDFGSSRRTTPEQVAQQQLGHLPTILGGMSTKRKAGKTSRANTETGANPNNTNQHKSSKSLGANLFSPLAQHSMTGAQYQRTKSTVNASGNNNNDASFGFDENEKIEKKNSGALSPRRKTAATTMNKSDRHQTIGGKKGYQPPLLPHTPNNDDDNDNNNNNNNNGQNNTPTESEQNEMDENETVPASVKVKKLSEVADAGVNDVTMDELNVDSPDNDGGNNGNNSNNSSVRKSPSLNAISKVFNDQTSLHLQSSQNFYEQSDDPYQSSLAMMTTQVGTFAFMAPEILRHLDVGDMAGGWTKPSQTEKEILAKEGIDIDKDNNNNNGQTKSKIPFAIPKLNINKKKKHKGSMRRTYKKRSENDISWDEKDMEKRKAAKQAENRENNNSNTDNKQNANKKLASALSNSNIEYTVDANANREKLIKNIGQRESISESFSTNVSVNSAQTADLVGKLPILANRTIKPKLNQTTSHGLLFPENEENEELITKKKSIHNKASTNINIVIDKADTIDYDEKEVNRLNYLHSPPSDGNDSGNDNKGVRFQDTTDEDDDNDAFDVPYNHSDNDNDIRSPDSETQNKSKSSKKLWEKYTNGRDKSNSFATVVFAKLFNKGNFITIDSDTEMENLKKARQNRTSSIHETIGAADDPMHFLHLPKSSIYAGYGNNGSSNETSTMSSHSKNYSEGGNRIDRKLAQKKSKYKYRKRNSRKNRNSAFGGSRTRGISRSIMSTVSSMVGVSPNATPMHVETQSVVNKEVNSGNTEMKSTLEEAPEHHETQQYQFQIDVSDTSLYSQSVDVFAFGVVMWEVLLLERIYDGLAMIEIRNLILSGKRVPVPTYDEIFPPVRESKTLNTVIQHNGEMTSDNIDNIDNNDNNDIANVENTKLITSGSKTQTLDPRFDNFNIGSMTGNNSVLKLQQGGADDGSSFYEYSDASASDLSSSSVSNDSDNNSNMNTNGGSRPSKKHQLQQQQQQQQQQQSQQHGSEMSVTKSQTGTSNKSHKTNASNVSQLSNQSSLRSKIEQKLKRKKKKKKKERKRRKKTTMTIEEGDENGGANGNVNYEIEPSPDATETQPKPKKYEHFEFVTREVYNEYVELLNACWGQNLLERPKFYQITNKLEDLYEMHRQNVLFQESKRF